MTDGPDVAPHVAEAAELLGAAPAGEPGLQVRRGRTAVVMIRTTATGDDDVDVVVTIQLVGAPAADLARSWVAAGPSSSRRYAEIDGVGQAVLTGVPAGSWTVALAPGQPPSGGGEDPPEVAASLHPVADDDPVACCEALMGLRGHPLADPSAVLRLLREHPEPVVREAAADVVAELDDPVVRAALLTALGDAAPAVQQAAATGLGHPGQHDAVPPLIAVLADDTRDPGVREAAAESLGWIGDTAAVEALRDASDVGFLRETARHSLALLGEPVRALLRRPAELRAKLSIAAAAPVGPGHRRALRAAWRSAAPAPIGPERVVHAGASWAGRTGAVPESSDLDALNFRDVLSGMGRITVERPVAMSVGAVTMLIFTDAVDASGEEGSSSFALRLSAPAELAGVRVSLRSAGEVIRVHSGRLDDQGLLVLRGVAPAEYLAVAHIELESARPVTVFADRPGRRVAVRGPAAVPGDTAPLLEVHDPEGRTMTVLRDGSDIVAHVVGLGISDRRTVLELPIVIDPAEVQDLAGPDAIAQVERLVVPLRWNPETGRCEARVAVHRGDAVDLDRPPQLLEPSELMSVRAVVVSVLRTRSLAPYQWSWLATDERVPRAVREVVRATTDGAGRGR